MGIYLPEKVIFTEASISTQIEDNNDCFVI